MDNYFTHSDLVELLEAEGTLDTATLAKEVADKHGGQIERGPRTSHHVIVNNKIVGTIEHKNGKFHVPSGNAAGIITTHDSSDLALASLHATVKNRKPGS